MDDAGPTAVVRYTGRIPPSPTFKCDDGVKTQVEDRGLEPRTVADRCDIDVADVYGALTYDHDHPEEMRAVGRQREEAAEDHEHVATDPDDVRD